jgi:hypothetical protein
VGETFLGTMTPENETECNSKTTQSCVLRARLQHYYHKHPLNHDKLNTSLILIPVGRKPNKTKASVPSCVLFSSHPLPVRLHLYLLPHPLLASSVSCSVTVCAGYDVTIAGPVLCLIKSFRYCYVSKLKFQSIFRPLLNNSCPNFWLQAHNCLKNRIRPRKMETTVTSGREVCLIKIQAPCFSSIDNIQSLHYKNTER